MIHTLIGTKSNMSAIFNPAGKRIPVTAIVADSNIVVGFKDTKVLIGFGRRKKTKKTENAQISAIGYSPRILKEVSTKPPQYLQQNPQQPEDTENKVKIGDKITVSIFNPGDKVKVSGITKGRGFAGVVKRWGFAGGPKTHGQSDRHRAPGSIGAGTTPGRVFRGKKMAGHMGNSKLTVVGLEIIDVDKDKNTLFVKGSIPGHKNGILIIEKTGKVKKPSMTQIKIKEVSPASPARSDSESRRSKQVSEEVKEGKKETKENKSSGSSGSSVTSETSEVKEGGQNAN